MIAGIAGLAVAVLSIFFLKELAPALRDQVMVDAHDRALVEARMKGIDVEASLRHPARQMLKPDIILAVGGAIVFIPLIWVMAGSWDPRRAKRAIREHDALVDAELANEGH